MNKEIKEFIKELDKITNNIKCKNVDDELSNLIDLVLKIDKKLNTNFINEYVDNVFIHRDKLIYDLIYFLQGDMLFMAQDFLKNIDDTNKDYFYTVDYCCYNIETEHIKETICEIKGALKKLIVTTA